MTYDRFPIGFKGEYRKPVSEDDNIAFATLSGDLNPVHFKDEAARKAGFKGKISNGFVTESRIAAALVETFGSDEALVVAIEKNTRFLKPVYMEDDITATVEVVGHIPERRALEIKAACFNQHGVQVIAANIIITLFSISNS
jgi:3-hydroxybutyryl-CoA dehydratase